MTRHRVTHGFVTVQTAVTPDGARAWVDVVPGALLPEDVLADQVAALLGQGRIEAVDEPGTQDPPGDGGEGSGSGPDDVQRPARSASKADWLAYAQAVAPQTGGLDELTKEKLIEQYGGSD